MDKTPAVNSKRGNKHLKTKNKQPLKVVYITNPIKFTATASEFRALVQELTGQDADVSDSSRFAAADGVGAAPEEVKVAAEGNVHALEEQVGEIGQSNLFPKGSDLSRFGSDDDDAIYSAEMMDGLASSIVWHQDPNLDVFKTLDAM